MNFIKRNVFSFFNAYDYAKQFPGAPVPALKDVSFRFLFASKYFESKLNEFKSEAIKNG